MKIRHQKYRPQLHKITVLRTVSSGILIKRSGLKNKKFRLTVVSFLKTRHVKTERLLRSERWDRNMAALNGTEVCRCFGRYYSLHFCRILYIAYILIYIGTFLLLAKQNEREVCHIYFTTCVTTCLFYPDNVKDIY